MRIFGAAIDLIFLAVPHAARADDIHNGYFIPKGTVVLPNVW